MKILLILILAAAASSIASYGVLFPGFDVDVQGVEIWEGRQDILDAGGSFICECEIDGEFTSENCDMDMDGQFDEMFESSQLLCTFVPSTPGNPPVEGEGEGCIAEYWANQISSSGTVPNNWPPEYQAQYYYNNIFQTNIILSSSSNPTLLDALNSHEGEMGGLARESTAAILNAAHWDVDYQYTVTEVMLMAQSSVIGSSSSQETIEELIMNNRLGAAICPPNEDQGDEEESNVLVCHNGKFTLNIAEPALAAHLGHGDIEGECSDTGDFDEDDYKNWFKNRGLPVDDAGKGKDNDKGDKDD